MEANKLIGLLIAMGIVVGLGCVKEPQDIPPGFTTDPAFELNGLIGTTSLNIGAGTDGWTVQPFVNEHNSNLVYTSLFSQNGCTQNCSPSLEFRFYRELPPNNEPLTEFQQTIHPGEIEFVEQDQARDSFDITLSTHPGLFMSGFSYWQDQNNPGTSYLSEYGSIVGFEDNLNVCFESHVYTGCQYSQCISFDPQTLVPCIARIEVKIDSIIRLIAQPEQGTPPFSYHWENGANGFTTASMILPLQNNDSEIFANVIVTDALGNFTILRQTIRIINTQVDACYFPISLISQELNNNNPEFSAGKVEIIYTDENGIVWRSTAGTQPQDATLFVNGLDYYGVSPSADQTYKVELHANLELFNEITGESQRLVLQDANIPLSY